MDFEKEAREIFSKYADDIEIYLRENLRKEIINFARRAFIAGQVDMREIVTNFMEPGKQPCDCASLCQTVDGPRWFHSCMCSNFDDSNRIAMWCSAANDVVHIRSLPTLESGKESNPPTPQKGK